MKETLNISQLKDALNSLKESSDDYKKAERGKMKEYIQDSCVKST